MARHRPPTISDEVASPTWSGAPSPLVSVHIASYRRGDLLPGLFAGLERQDLSRHDFEVVVVDDASDDGTWDVIRDTIRRSPLRARGLLLADNRGPATVRNTAVAASTGEIVAFTDDDCVPTPGWLTALIAAMGTGSVVVQGRVTPPPDETDGAAWDHTIRVNGPSPFFETCNVAYRRDDFWAAGGFDTEDPLLHPGPGQHFGEDAVLGSQVVGAGAARAFAPDAVVHHRVIRRTFVEHLRAQRKLEGFPGLAVRSPVFASRLRRGVFLTRRSAAFDLAVAAVGVAVVSRRRFPLLGTLVWVAEAWPAVRGRARRPSDIPGVYAGLAVTDLVTLVSLVAGSVRYRRPIL